MAARSVENLGFVFLGVGHPHAGGWAQAIRSTPGARLIGAYDPRPERLEAFLHDYGGERCELSRLLDPDVGAAIVDGRNNEVRDLSLAALEKDLPLFLEKPGGFCASDLERVRTEARSRGKVVQIGYFLRYADSVAEAKRLLEGGDLGKVSLARLHVSMPRRAWEEMGEWFRDPENIVGTFQEDACHVVDIALHLFGQPETVTARSTAGGFEGGLGEDALVAILGYESFLVSIDFTAREANPWVQSWGFEVYGTGATIRADLATPSRMERCDEGGSSWRQVKLPDRQGDGLYFRRAIEAFIRAVRGETPSPVNASAGLRVFRTIEAIYESAKNSAGVRLRDGAARGAPK